MEVIGNNLLDNPAVSGIVVNAHDITERKRAEKALQEGERRFREILENVELIAVIIDIEGRVTFCNDYLLRLTGYSRTDVLGQNWFALFVPPELHIEDVLLAALRQGIIPAHFENEILNASGEHILVSWNNTILRDIEGHVIGTTSIGEDITERKRVEEELAKSHTQLRALTAYWQNAIEAERAHISREIHDEFGQSMTALKMDLAWLAKRLPKGDERVERIRGMSTLVDDSIALMRRIATELRPNLLDDLGLSAALKWQAQEFSRRSGIPCKLNAPKDDLALDPALNTTLFRIFQETLTNITRHAQATRVSVSLKQKEQTLVLTIRDNGRGITEGELTNPHSLGLLGLRERAAQWEGETTLRGAAGKGTTVTVRIPLPASLVNGGR